MIFEGYYIGPKLSSFQLNFISLGKNAVLYDFVVYNSFMLSTILDVLIVSASFSVKNKLTFLSVISTIEILNFNLVSYGIPKDLVNTTKLSGLLSIKEIKYGLMPSNFD